MRLSFKRDTFASFMESYQMQIDALEENRKSIQAENVRKAIRIILGL